MIIKPLHMSASNITCMQFDSCYGHAQDWNFIYNYFVKKYYLPDLPTKISSNLYNFANSSIDISDGLFGDLTKLINKSKLYYKVDLNKVPVSQFHKFLPPERYNIYRELLALKFLEFDLILFYIKVK